MGVGLIGNHAALGVGVDNAITGLQQLLTNQPTSTLVAQGVGIIGEKTGWYTRSQATNISNGLSIIGGGVAGVTKKSTNTLKGLDLAISNTVITKIHHLIALMS